MTQMINNVTMSHAISITQVTPANISSHPPAPWSISNILQSINEYKKAGTSQRLLSYVSKAVQNYFPLIADLRALAAWPLGLSKAE